MNPRQETICAEGAGTDIKDGEGMGKLKPNNPLTTLNLYGILKSVDNAFNHKGGIKWL